MKQRPYAKPFGLPLLQKELVEQAARGRTYLIRVAYAALVFIIFGFYFYEEVTRFRVGSRMILGAGGRLFRLVVGAQMAGVYLFLPAMVSGAIAHEKEKRTLELLFITDLTPWEIVLEKLGGRLVPMFTFLLLSLPLMAVCYAYGGLSSEEVVLSTFVLVTACVLVGAFALMMSAYYDTGGRALYATYLYGIGLMMAVFMGAGLVALITMPFLGPYATVFMAVPLGLFPPAMLGLRREIPMALLGAAASWGWAVFFLYRARRYLVTRAFVRPKRRKLGFFHALGPVVLIPKRRAGKLRYPEDTTRFPADEPITWREVTRTALGGPYWLARMSAITGIPVFLLGGMALGAAYESRSSPLTWLVVLTWLVAALGVSMMGVGVLARERANRTLDILLATPLAGEEIIRQKSRAARRLIAVFMTPFLVLFALTAIWQVDRGRAGRDLGPAGYLAVSALSVPLFLSAFAWVSRWIGLVARSRARATLIVLGTLFLWNAAPALLAFDGGPWFFVLSPAALLVLVEVATAEDAFREVFRTSPAAPLFLSFALHGLVLLGFRTLCLRRADAFLGRPSPPDQRQPNRDGQDGQDGQDDGRDGKGVERGGVASTTG